jgi:hypothetical protein
MLIAGAGDAGMNVSAFRFGCVLAARPSRRDHLARLAAEARAGGELRTTFGAYVLTDADAAAIVLGALGDAGVRGGVFNTFHRWLDGAELAGPLSALLGRPVAAPCGRAPPPVPGVSNARIAARYSDWSTDRLLPDLLRAALAAP